MTINQFKHLLSQYPAGMEVKIFQGVKKGKMIINDFSPENLVETADDDKLNEEESEVIRGEGERYLLINPPIQ